MKTPGGSSADVAVSHGAARCPRCGGELLVASFGGVVHWYAAEDPRDPSLWVSTWPRSRAHHGTRELMLRCRDVGCARLVAFVFASEDRGYVPPLLRAACREREGNLERRRDARLDD